MKQPLHQEHGALTRRQQDILALLALGKTNSDIAACLKISVNTVKRDLASAHRLLGTSSRPQLAAVVYRERVVPLPPQPSGPVPALSPRQGDALSLIAEGKSIPQTAEELGLATETTRRYLVRAREALGGAGSSAGAVGLLYRWRLRPLADEPRDQAVVGTAHESAPVPAE
ncbi:LuxR C-terminal-related transcriptional regulator [Streptomyces sp. NPDC088745]|uniref:helix-turn-helix domain-containing protein n=1 Tax=Streptomyces sp. NPDC088745 TaxID=3365884 RepID=UPI00382F516E